MQKLIEFQTDDGETIYFEPAEMAVEEPTGQQLASAGDRVVKATKSLESALAPISKLVRAAVDAVKDADIGPDGIEVELGLKLSADANVIVSKAGGEAALTIKAIWEKGKG